MRRSSGTRSVGTVEQEGLTRYDRGKAPSSGSCVLGMSMSSVPLLGRRLDVHGLSETSPMQRAPHVPAKLIRFGRRSCGVRTASLFLGLSSASTFQRSVVASKFPCARPDAAARRYTDAQITTATCAPAARRRNHRFRGWSTRTPLRVDSGRLAASLVVEARPQCDTVCAWMTSSKASRR